MEKIEQLSTNISGVHIEKIKLEEPFMDLAARFADDNGTVVLMSGGDLDCARYHILAGFPWLTFTGLGNNMTVTTGDQTFDFKGNPFNTLQILVKQFNLSDQGLPSPISAGLLGYLAYDLKDHLEDLPRTTVDDLHLPQICFFAPSFIVVHDKKYNETSLCIPEKIVNGKSFFEKDRTAFFKQQEKTPAPKEAFGGDPEGFKSNFRRDRYLAAIDKIREYIASGHVYQVNMSQRFKMGFTGNGFSLFETLYKKNPAPFFAFINAGNHQIISTSPERFILRDRERVETRPIKGTRPRGKTIEEDNALREDLQHSKKDDAELSMIVDLLRNDIGKVCESGSVKVAQHKRTETYQNVYHLVSIVDGKLSENRSSIDLLKATFPGGSITGCPKIRAMEIIDELESHRRHIYTGSIGYISFHDTMDLSIAIRTATVHNNKIIFSVGGGIVYDSDPADEFDETCHKGKTLLDVFSESTKTATPKPVVWLNGQIILQEEATVPLTDLGAQYGFGFFETVRVVNGKGRYLDKHIDRFNNSWVDLFDEMPPDVTWKEVIGQVISQNNLGNNVAAVKILATRGSSTANSYDHTHAVMTRPYKHRLEEKNKPGLDLMVYKEPRQTPLADYKTLNYLYYLNAGRWAAEHGGDEALIINSDGSISETNTANIILIRNNTFILPESPHVLPGIMCGIVCDLLTEKGFSKKSCPVFTEDLFLSDQVLLTNSLMGAVPVRSLDGRKINFMPDLSEEINRKVL
ncbi:MAG: aminodeoxychorismate synthase component I [Desulfobacterales bacterium]|nr:aminodeoxychorismate synthase component I [Desulfobacterales bacterium]